MKNRKSHWLINGLTVFCCLLLAEAPAHAKRLKIKRTVQEKSNWCWAASTQMVLSRYKIAKKQSEIVKYVKGSLVNQTAEPSEIVRGMIWGGIPATNVESVASEQQIKSDADKGRPFIFAWYWSQGGGHALVYDGYEGNQHYVIDPWQNNGTTAHSYSSLKNAGGKGTWGGSMTCDKDSEDPALDSVDTSEEIL